MLGPNQWARARGLQPEEKETKVKKAEASIRDRTVYRVTSVKHGYGCRV